MKKMLDLLSAEVAKAFAKAGYDEKYARVSLSNRPDLCGCRHDDTGVKR